MPIVNCFEILNDPKEEPRNACVVDGPRRDVRCRVFFLEEWMRFIIVGLLVGSALGVLAGTAASGYVTNKPQVLYRDQVIAYGSRTWDI